MVGLVTSYGSLRSPKWVGVVDGEDVNEEMALSLVSLAVGLVSLALASFAIWLHLTNKKDADKRFESIENQEKAIRKEVRPIRHIRRQVGGKHKKKSG